MSETLYIFFLLKNNSNRFNFQISKKQIFFFFFFLFSFFFFYYPDEHCERYITKNILEHLVVNVLNIANKRKNKEKMIFKKKPKFAAWR